MENMEINFRADRIRLFSFIKGEFAIAGEFTYFFGRFFKEVVRPPLFWKEFTRQSFQIGYKSLPLVSITSFIIGLVLTLQSRPSLVQFGAESMLPGMISNSI